MHSEPFLETPWIQYLTIPHAFTERPFTAHLIRLCRFTHLLLNNITEARQLFFQSLTFIVKVKLHVAAGYMLSYVYHVIKIKKIPPQQNHLPDRIINCRIHGIERLRIGSRFHPIRGCWAWYYQGKVTSHQHFVTKALSQMSKCFCRVTRLLYSIHHEHLPRGVMSTTSSHFLHKYGILGLN